MFILKIQVDFFSDFCHHGLAMQKIEKWKIGELSLSLDELARLFLEGNNREWANVFKHFREEAQKILSKTEFDLNALWKLVANIKNCFSESQYFAYVVLRNDDSEERLKLDHDFFLVRSRLLEILKDLERQARESIH